MNNRTRHNIRTIPVRKPAFFAERFKLCLYSFKRRCAFSFQISHEHYAALRRGIPDAVELGTGREVALCILVLEDGEQGIEIEGAEREVGSER